MTYRYTYATEKGIPGTYTTEVEVMERGEHDGMVIYVLRPAMGWPHRGGRQSEPLLRAIPMKPSEEHEWLNVDLVPVEPKEGRS